MIFLIGKYMKNLKDQSQHETSNYITISEKVNIYNKSDCYYIQVRRYNFFVIIINFSRNYLNKRGLEWNMKEEN